MKNLPHPIPYQGSKRLLAGEILGVVPRGHHVRRWFEPFAGSSAMTIAAADVSLADAFVIGDSLSPLIEIWRRILADPSTLASNYARIWSGQKEGDDGYYARVRQDFNDSGSPAQLLYLLARCVKNSPRWNKDGGFNQSEDKRRLGMNPTKMEREIIGANGLLRDKTVAVAGDFEEVLKDAQATDLVYLDPPWEGTSAGRDKRYHRGLERDRLVAVLSDLSQRGVPWILSYDGRCGEKTYGEPLPVNELDAVHLELHAGRSSQATLNGVDADTVESLYVARSLKPVVAQKARVAEQISFLAVDRDVGLCS